MQTSSCWTDELSYADTLEVLRDLARSHAREGGAVGLRLLELIDTEDYAALIAFNLKLDEPGWDVLQLLHCRQVIGLFKKLEALDLGIDKEAVAFKKFQEAEQQCKLSNDLFRSYAAGTACLPPRSVRLLEAARRKIASVLGRCPKISELKLSFGPGATTATKKSLACPAYKMASGPQCSTDLYASGRLPELLRELPHLCAAWGETWSLDYDASEQLLSSVSTLAVELHKAKLDFVPKTALTFRTITVEPMLNTLLQAGIRKWMKARLMQAGIDITDQTRNQRLAWQASINGLLATLDLSSASDTICYWLVKLLLPPDWFSLLAAARTSTVVYKGECFSLEKFAAMGNATTFPLETLIFWALTVSQCSESSQVGIYGDDIICPVSKADDVIWGLTTCGFTVSSAKSFTSGPFRESCGGDYYFGFSVVPFYQKKLVSARTLFTLHNYYVRGLQYEFAAKVLSYIPESLRLFGPDGYGDGHLLGAWTPVTSRKLISKGYAGGTFETFSLISRKVRPPFAGDWVSPLYSIYTRAGEEILPEYYWEDCGWRSRSPSDSSSLSVTKPVQFDEAGFPLWGVPGSEGYKRQKIYTFCTS